MSSLKWYLSLLAVTVVGSTTAHAGKPPSYPYTWKKTSTDPANFPKNPHKLYDNPVDAASEVIRPATDKNQIGQVQRKFTGTGPTQYASYVLSVDKTTKKKGWYQVVEYGETKPQKDSRPGRVVFMEVSPTGKPGYVIVY